MRQPVVKPGQAVAFWTLDARMVEGRVLGTLDLEDKRTWLDQSRHHYRYVWVETAQGGRGWFEAKRLIPLG